MSSLEMSKGESRSGQTERDRDRSQARTKREPSRDRNRVQNRFEATLDGIQVRDRTEGRGEKKKIEASQARTKTEPNRDQNQAQVSLEGIRARGRAEKTETEPNRDRSQARTEPRRDRNQAQNEFEASLEWIQVRGRAEKKKIESSQAQTRTEPNRDRNQVQSRFEASVERLQVRGRNEKKNIEASQAQARTEPNRDRSQARNKTQASLERIRARGGAEKSKTEPDPDRNRALHEFETTFQGIRARGRAEKSKAEPHRDRNRSRSRTEARGAQGQSGASSEPSQDRSQDRSRGGTDLDRAQTRREPKGGRSQARSPAPAGTGRSGERGPAREGRGSRRAEEPGGPGVPVPVPIPIPIPAGGSSASVGGERAGRGARRWARPGRRRQPSSGEEAAPGTTMAAQSVLQLVEKLQSRLADNPDPKKLLKHLKRLSDLPITIDILVETGVGKTVNGLRKHELVGGFAKDLVARWKRLVPTPQEVERSTLEEEDRSVSRKRPREPSPRPQVEEEDDDDAAAAVREDWRASCSQSRSPEHRGKKAKRLPGPERPARGPLLGEPREDRSRWGKASPLYSSDQEYSDPGQAQSPEPSGSPQGTYRDPYRSQEPGDEPPAAHRKPPRGPGEPGTRSKEHKSAHRDGRRGPEAAGSREEGRRPPSGDGAKDKLTPAGGPKREKEREGGGSRKRPLPEATPGNQAKKPKLKDSERPKPDRPKAGADGTEGARWRWDEDPAPRGREKGAVNSTKTQEGKARAPDADRKAAAPPLAGPAEAEAEDEFEPPTMSFESYLSYDQPQRKKKKPLKAAGSEGDKGHHKQNGSKAGGKGSDPVPKPAKETESRPERRPPADGPAKAKKASARGAGGDPLDRAGPPGSGALLRCGALNPSLSLCQIPIDVVPTLPDIPLPTMQTTYRPLPSLDLTPPSQPKRKVVSWPQEEEESGFTGRRLNSKMQVYSGSKSAYLPKMMSLYEQCIRVLNNNIDSIYEVGGVPYSVLEPVLERCTPEQLYRIEECNHVLIEESDQLWRTHCQRDFKRERPEEFESWREMYLRLHDAREQRLLLLTQNIRSAHANKPKGRQAKMAFVNSVAKPPRDVRRRQEKFGTGGAAVAERIKIKPAPFTSGSSGGGGYASGSGSNHSSNGPAYDGPSTSSVHSAPHVVSYDPRKPPVKSKRPCGRERPEGGKRFLLGGRWGRGAGGGGNDRDPTGFSVAEIAPMMAKTIKAFKNRFSRR
uniref:Elongin-A n=1 Tax=Ornithorhynchus anatinus TaxID=9258 RepID=A0A6I8PH67_ORNAN